MPDWVETLYCELDEWNFDGVEATFWWRDDDAQSPSPALDRVLDLAQQYGVQIALSVIPEPMENALATRLKTASATVLQHGFSHINYAPSGEKKMELGDHRLGTIVCDQLVAGFSVLDSVFGDQFIPVLVPPWNRIAPSLLRSLAKIGFIGLSTYDARQTDMATSGIRSVNTHVDIIDWKHGKRFIGAQRASKSIVEHLRGRRLGMFDSAEPTGLLTHHLVHDAECDQFLSELLASLDDHPAVRWRTAGELFSR